MKSYWKSAANCFAKILKPYYHSSKAVDQLHFKEVFRQAALRSVITPELCERFLEYRDNRNNTAHDYGANFTEETLLLLPNFITGATDIAATIRQQDN